MPSGKAIGKKVSRAQLKRPASPSSAPRSRQLEKLPRGAIQFVPPMQCKLVSNLPPSTEWLYEVKFDGYRALALKENSDVRLMSRNVREFTSSYPQVAAAVRELPSRQIILDGEIVALDEQGRSSFQLMQNLPADQDRKTGIYYYVFDILNLEGRDLKGLPVEKRKELLEELLRNSSPVLRLSPALEADAETLIPQVRKQGLEGLIAKLRGSRYEPGLRTGTWVKFKTLNEQEFIIGGYTPPEGSRGYFGALLLGYYAGQKLMFASKVGTGFTHKLLASLHARFQPLVIGKCPFVNLPTRQEGRWHYGISPSAMRKCTWLNPKLVCQVRFTEWTRDGGLRHPAFQGLREDKNASEVVREKPSA